MWPNPQETVDLVTFTEEMLNGKRLFYEASFNFIPCVEVKISRKGAHPSSKKVMYKEITLKCRNTKHSFRQY